MFARNASAIPSELGYARAAFAMTMLAAALALLMIVASGAARAGFSGPGSITDHPASAHLTSRDMPGSDRLDAMLPASNVGETHPAANGCCDVHDGFSPDCSAGACSPCLALPAAMDVPVGEGASGGYAASAQAQLGSADPNTQFRPPRN
jgi:hypothetical protein